MTERRAQIDFNAVEKHQHEIDARLRNWGRWCNGSGHPEVSPMFRMTPPAPRQRGDGATYSDSVDGADAAKLAPAVSALPEKHRAAVNWAYVRPVSPKRACQAIGTNMEGLALLLRDGRQRAVFDPSRAQRTFRICMTDITHLALLPALINRLGDIAPGINVQITHISGQTPKMLESGEADLAVGFMPQLEAGFYQQKLFDQDFACVVRSQHPRIRSRLSPAMFKRERHVVVTGDGTGQALPVLREVRR